MKWIGRYNTVGGVVVEEWRSMGFIYLFICVVWIGKVSFCFSLKCSTCKIKKYFVRWFLMILAILS